MTVFRTLLATLALAALTACSSGPGDRDVQAVAAQALTQVDQALKPAGMSFSDVFDMQVKVLNKADQGNNRWLVDVETTLVPKKSITDLPPDSQLVLGVSLGQFQKGQALPPSRGSVTMTKGDNGWTSVQ